MNELRDPRSAEANRWARKAAAAGGCLALVVTCLYVGTLVYQRSWNDLVDADVRRRFFRIHGIDWDFIWSVSAFAMIVVTVLAMLMCCAWMITLLLKRWRTL